MKPFIVVITAFFLLVICRNSCAQNIVITGKTYAESSLSPLAGVVITLKEYVQANEKYTKLEKALQALSGKANVFAGTVDWGEQKFSHVREGIIRFAKDNNKNYSDVIVNLTPLMSIAGDHAQNDLQGGLENGKTMADVDPYEDDEDPQFSWILKLKKLGFQMNAQGTTTTTSGCNVIGLGDHKSIRAIWAEHMLEARKSAISWNQHLGGTK